MPPSSNPQGGKRQVTDCGGSGKLPREKQALMSGGRICGWVEMAPARACPGCVGCSAEVQS